MINFGTISTANITPRALMSPCVDEPKARVVSIAARSKVVQKNLLSGTEFPECTSHMMKL